MNNRREKILLNNNWIGSIRIGNQYIDKENISYLYQIDDPIIIDIDEDFEEIFLDSIPPQLNPKHNYHVISEKHLNKDKVYYPNEKVTEEAKKEFIKRHYKPLHPHLYVFNESFLDEKLLKIIRTGEIKVDKLTETGLYNFPLFTEQFCQKFIEEIEHYEQSGLPVTRPNSMNNYGMILDDMGFTNFISELRIKIVSMFSSVLYKDFVGNNLDGHHAFIVSYKIGEDTELDMHYDNSEVTLNVCLGKEFTGGDLYFNGLYDFPETHNEEVYVEHKVGMALLHVGKHRHGATKIKSGERHNLIVWCTNSEYR